MVRKKQIIPPKCLRRFYLGKNTKGINIWFKGMEGNILRKDDFLK